MTNVDNSRLTGHEILDRVYLTDEGCVGADVVVASTSVTSQQLRVCLDLEDVPMLADEQQVKVIT